MQKGGRVMSNRKKMLISTHDLLINDEDLLRLLYYPPTSLREGQPNPLSGELSDVLDMDLDKLWGVRDHHIPLTSKADDLIENELCRIYLYLGKTRPSHNNFMTTKQEIVVDVFCHYSYIEADQRMAMISDRISALLFNQRVHGLGKVDYRNGYDFTAPKGYQAYRHIYEVGGVK